MLGPDGRPAPLPGEVFVTVFFNSDVSVLVTAATPLRALGAIYVSPQRVGLPLLINVHSTSFIAFGF